MFGLANYVTSCLQHVLFCQPCIFLFAICFALKIVYRLLYNMFCLPTVYLLVYNMLWFANSLTSCLHHVLFYQSCSFLFTTCFTLPTVQLLVCHMFCFANRVSSCLQHDLSCQPCSFLFTTCFILSTVQLLVCNMLSFANLVIIYFVYHMFALVV